MEPVKFFISYSHQDEDFKNELLEFLNPLKRSGKIQVWEDRAILVGDKWNEEIRNALNESDVVLFLISPSFLASDFINDVEIVEAMERHNKDQVRLVPIMLRTSDLNSHIVPNQEYKISDFQGLPTNMKPINKWEPRDDGWMNVVKGLRPIIELIQKENSSKENPNS